jgi:hypothetical protein
VFGLAVHRALLALLALSGCILPPPVAVQESVNHEPFIVDEAARPQKAFVEVNFNCAVCVFSVQVEDPDLGDRLFFRWFYDYEAQPDAAPFCVTSLAPPNDPNAPRDLVSCDVSINEPPRGNPDDDTIHTLEVWISDRDFVVTDELPRNRVVPEEAKIARKQWTVRWKRRGIGCVDVEQLSCREKR